MRIGIDLDEVLADFMSAIIKFHNSKYKTNFNRNDFHSYKLYEIWGGTHKEAIKEIYEFYETEYFTNILPIPGSIENIEVLSRDNELVVITSRQNYISEKTLDWIDKFFKNRFSGVYFTNQNSLHGNCGKKSDICRNTSVKCMVEDYIDYATECSKAVEKVFLLDSPWNRTADLPENISRVYSWSEITEDLLRKNERSSFFFDNFKR